MTDVSTLRRFSAECISLVMLLAGVAGSHFGLFGRAAWPEAVWYAAAALPVARDIAARTFGAWRRLDFFNEYTLMLLAAVGAFLVGEYPEGVAVLLFYSVGEKLEASASDRARDRIRSLLERIPDSAEVEEAGGTTRVCKPDEVAVGDTVIVKAGERVALDGTLLGDPPYCSTRRPSPAKACRRRSVRAEMYVRVTFRSTAPCGCASRSRLPTAPCRASCI